MNFKEYEDTIKVNDKLLPCIISIKVYADDVDPSDDFDFGDDEENSKYLKRFTSGELFMGVVVVEARALGELGVSSLGACHLVSNNFFNHTPFENSVNETVRDYDMLEEAKSELVKSIQDKVDLLLRSLE